MLLLFLLVICMLDIKKCLNCMGLLLNCVFVFLVIWVSKLSKLVCWFIGIKLDLVVINVILFICFFFSILCENYVFCLYIKVLVKWFRVFFNWYKCCLLWLSFLNKLIRIICLLVFLKMDCFSGVNYLFWNLVKCLLNILN